MRFSKLIGHVTSSLWFVPVLCVLAGVAISFGTIALDRAFDYDAIPQSLVGGPTAAAEILSTVAVSMVSLTALVLTITMVVVQLAMGQFSPRIVQRILQDKPSQLAIGLFVATFVHAILALREVTDLGDGTGQVPGIAVVTAFVLVLVSIAVLVLYVHHIGQSLRVSSLIELVGKDTRKLIERKYPDQVSDEEPEPGSPRVVRAEKSGVITAIGFDGLVEEAERADCVLELVPALGEFVPAEAPLFRVHGEAHGLDEKRLQTSLIFAARADARGGRRLRRPPPRRHRRALARRVAVPGSDHRRSGDRPPARHPETARAEAVPGRPPSRRGGHGPAHRSLDELGGICPARVRRDPHGGGGVASGLPDGSRPHSGSQGDRSAGSGRGPR